MLASCVTERAERMRRPLSCRYPTDRQVCSRRWFEYGTGVVCEVSRPEVLATYRLAILEAENAPDVAHTLDRHGREANATALIGLLTAARKQGLLGQGEAAGNGSIFMTQLTGGGMLVRLLMRVAGATQRGGSAPAGRTGDEMAVRVVRPDSLTRGFKGRCGIAG